MTQALQLLVVAWLPGAVIFRLPFAEREKRAALDPEERAFWAVVISVCVSVAIVLVLSAIGRYRFDRLLLADLIVAALASAIGGFRLRLKPARHVGVTFVLPLALIVLGLWRFFPPSEYVIGGKDPGTYMNEGIQIAQRGALVVHDPVVAAVPAFARDLFFPSYQRPDYFSLRFMGFFVRSPDEGTVVGQFPHAFPASIAIGYGLDGLTGARRTVGFWAILGVLAVYFAAARIFGRAIAWTAAAMLTLHVIEVWFARYPNTEVVMQALLFAAMLASARAHTDDDAFFAPVAAATLGLLLFVRVEAVIGVACIVGALLLARTAGGRLRASFVVVLAASLALAAIYMLGPMEAYIHLPIVFLRSLVTRHLWLWIALAIGAAAALLVLRSRARACAAPVAKYAPAVFTAALVAGAVYALYLRHPGGRLAPHDAYALRTFTSDYFTLPALIAALVGYALWARRAFWRAPELFVSTALFACFFFYKVRIVPDHFWMARRFLTIILPAGLLFACAAALGTRQGPLIARAIGRIVGVTFIGLLAMHYARASRPLLDHVEYAGVIPKLEALARTVGHEDLLVVESRNAGTDLHTLALPLSYIYDRPVLVLSSPLPDKTTFAGFLEWAQAHYRRVLFMGGGGTDLLSAKWGARVVATDRFQVPEYDDPGNEYPRYARPKQFDYTIFEFTPPAGDATDRIDIDVGDRDDLNVLRFHAKEQTEGRMFRWSRNVSYVVLPTVTADSAGVTIWLSDGGRPAAAGPADVQIALGGETLGTLRVTTGFAPYSLEIPTDLAVKLAATGQPVQLRLETTAWVPEKLLGTPDDRELGVMVDRVSVQ